jgi:hypothetical protein
MQDMGIFVEIERYYNLRKVFKNQDIEIPIEKIKDYIEKSYLVSEDIQAGKVD